MKRRTASGKNTIRVDASYVFNRANPLFSARTARTGRPALRIARELCEATSLEGCRCRLCGRCPVDGDADRLAVTEWPRHHREHDGASSLCSRRQYTQCHNFRCRFPCQFPKSHGYEIRLWWSKFSSHQASIIFSDLDSPGLTVSYNTIDGGGNGAGSSLVSTAGAGAMTLTHNWLFDFSQHVLEMHVRNGQS
jgi:hypothetical protein